jgi:hypothetical protein
LSSAHTVLFTELVYSGLVNSSTNLPVNNFVMPQLTDYFPSGNPLRSCTTASLVSYTPNAQPVLAKRDAQPVPINTFPGVPALTAATTFTAERNLVDPSPSIPSSDSNDGGTTATSESAPASPPPTSSPVPLSSQQNPETPSDTPAPPSSIAQESSGTQAVTTSTITSSSPASSSSITQELPSTQPAIPSTTTTGDSVHDSSAALGTMSLASISTQMAGNSSSLKASTWNFVCSAEGCTLASSSGATATSADASSTNTTESSQTTAQSGSVRVVAWYSFGSIFLVVALVAVT